MIIICFNFSLIILSFAFHFLLFFNVFSILFVKSVYLKQNRHSKKFYSNFFTFIFIFGQCIFCCVK